MDTKPNKKLPAADWLPFFIKADVLTKALAETHSAKGKTIKIGQFLTPNVNQTVPVQVKGRSGKATLRVEMKGHGKEKRYFFEVEWDSVVTPPAVKQQVKGTKLSISKSKPGAPKGTTPKPTPKAAAPKPTPTPTKPKSSVAKKGNNEVWD